VKILLPAEITGAGQVSCIVYDSLGVRVLGNPCSPTLNDVGLKSGIRSADVMRAR